MQFRLVKPNDELARSRFVENQSCLKRHRLLLIVLFGVGWSGLCDQVVGGSRWWKTRWDTRVAVRNYFPKTRSKEEKVAFLCHPFFFSFLVLPHFRCMIHAETWCVYVCVRGTCKQDDNTLVLVIIEPFLRTKEVL